uniref:Uncharacterized protein n=1 Tax=Oryza glaberrima TaxID=4538 RepID=I1NZN6_ORYGL
MSSSSSRGPGQLSTAPSQLQPSLIPDSPIPTAPSQRRGGVVAREMTGGESEEGEADGNHPSVTLALQSPFTVEPCVVAFPRRCHHIKAPHAWSSFPEAGCNGRSLAKAPSRSGQLPQQHRVHGPLHCSVRGSGLFCQRGHCLIHHRRGFFPFPKCTTYLPLRKLFFSNEIDRIPMAVATRLMLALMYHVVMGDDLDVRTDKPSLDMFLAEMRRFEVLPYLQINMLPRSKLLTLWPTGDFGKILSCFTMAFHCLAHEIVSASCMVVQLFGDIKEEITIWREAGFMDWQEYDTAVQWWEGFVSIPRIPKKPLKTLIIMFSWILSNEKNARIFRNTAQTPTALIQAIKDGAALWYRAGARCLTEFVPSGELNERKRKDLPEYDANAHSSDPGYQRWSCV